MSKNSKWIIGLTILFIVVTVWELVPTISLITMSPDTKKELSKNDPEKLARLEANAINLGLDLKGGMHLIVEVKKDELPPEQADDARQRVLEVIRNFYLKLLSSFNGSEGDFFSFQPNSIGTPIITDNRIVALRTFAFEAFLLSLDCRFEAFSSYNPCRNNELRRERGFFSYRVIGKFVELNPVPEFSTPTNLTSIVVGKLILFNGFKECLFLFFSRFKNKFKSALQFHIHILLQYLQTFKCGLLPSLTEGVSNRKEEKR